MMRELLEDARQLGLVAQGSTSWPQLLRLVVGSDSYKITAVQRARGWSRRWHLPGVNHALRVWQTAVCGIELGKDIRLGHGVWFIHPLGVVIGGNAQVGDRVRFFGNNTIGTAKENGYPVIENDVWVGAGARILGPIRVGARAVIGANAVVVRDVPADSVAVGVPARILPKDAAGGSL